MTSTIYEQKKSSKKFGDFIFLSYLCIRKGNEPKTNIIMTRQELKKEIEKMNLTLDTFKTKVEETERLNRELLADLSIKTELAKKELIENYVETHRSIADGTKVRTTDEFMFSILGLQKLIFTVKSAELTDSGIRYKVFSPVYGWGCFYEDELELI